jgi:hypothetical protein
VSASLTVTDGAASAGSSAREASRSAVEPVASSKSGELMQAVLPDAKGRRTQRRLASDAVIRMLGDVHETCRAELRPTGHAGRASGGAAR